MEKIVYCNESFDLSAILLTGQRWREIRIKKLIIGPDGKTTERNWAGEKESGLGKNQLNSLPQTSLGFGSPSLVFSTIGEPGLHHQCKMM